MFFPNVGTHWGDIPCGIEPEPALSILRLDVCLNPPLAISLLWPDADKVLILRVPPSTTRGVSNLRCK